MGLLVNFRVYLVVALVVLAAYWIFSPYVFKKSGVVVSFLEMGNKCSGISEGSVINQVAGAVVRSSQDFVSKTEFVPAGTYVPMVVNGGPAGCTAIRDGYFGLEVADVSSPQLKFSSELGESVLTTLKVGDVSKIDETLGIMKSRVASLKLVGYGVESENSIIKITSIDKDVSVLTKPCKFLIEVDRRFVLTKNETFVDLNGKKYTFVPLDSGFKLNGTDYFLDKTFYLENIETKLQREQNTTFLVRQIFANNSDVVIIGLHQIRYIPQAGFFRFELPLSVSADASNRFSVITKNVKTFLSGGVSVLDASFVYKIDEKVISEFPIPTEFTRENIMRIAVVAFDRDLKNLEDVSKELQFCLNSGTFSTNFEKVSVETLEPSGGFLAEISVVTFLISALAISFVLVQVRYKIYKYWYVLAALVLAELFIIFGLIAVAQSFTGFLIDLVTVYGFSVFGAISVGQMLFGVEYILQKKELSLSYRVKKFNQMNLLVNVFVLVAALTLLFFARGFGFVLLFGLVVSLITKPILFNILTKMQM